MSNRVSTSNTGTRGGTDRSARSPLYSSVVGLASLGVLLQGLWAGLFIQEGREYDSTWVEVHAIDADVVLALAVISAIIAFVKLRSRRDLLLGSVALAVLVALEAFLGGLIGDHSGLTAVHFPLALGIMGLAVWLPVRAVLR